MDRLVASIYFTAAKTSHSLLEMTSRVRQREINMSPLNPQNFEVGSVNKGSIA